MVLTIKEFKISPFEWKRLSRFDQKVLMYQRVMEEHYMDTHSEKQAKEHEKEQNRQKFLDRLPKQVGIR